MLHIFEAVQIFRVVVFLYLVNIVINLMVPMSLVF